MSAIEGFEYQIGHRYTLRVRRTILANPPADASSYTYKLLEINEDRVWPPVDEPKEEIIVNKEEDIPKNVRITFMMFTETVTSLLERTAEYGIKATICLWILIMLPSAWNLQYLKNHRIFWNSTK